MRLAGFVILTLAAPARAATVIVIDDRDGAVVAVRGLPDPWRVRLS